jgi:glycine/D-amino acid oxidase-like deaminating enzyme
MSNLYRETAPPAIAAAPLQGHLRADVAVIGGGFTGLSTALHLAERGAAVALLEAEEPGFGASGRNGGQVNPGLKFDPDTVEHHHGAELGARMNAMAGAAPETVFKLIERLAIRCEARRNGTLRAALTQAQTQRLRITFEQYARRGAPVEWLEGDALRNAIGHDRYRAALLDRRGGDLNPLSFARGLAQAAHAAKVRIYAATRARRLEAREGAWRVHSDAGSIDAAQVVVATNGYTDDLLPALRRSIVPVYGAIAATEPLSAALAATVMPSRAVLFEIGAITVYYRLDAQQRLLFGGRGPMCEVQDVRSVPHIVAYARHLWPALAQLRWTHAWGGRLAMTSDHYPHVHGPQPGLTVCLGYNGRGVAMATTLGAQLARHLVTPGAALDMPVSPIVPIRGHALWPLAVRGAILKGRLGDWIGL